MNKLNSIELLEALRQDPNLMRLLKMLAACVRDTDEENLKALQEIYATSFPVRNAINARSEALTISNPHVSQENLGILLSNDPEIKRLEAIDHECSVRFDYEVQRQFAARQHSKAKGGRPKKEKITTEEFDGLPYFKSRYSTGNIGTAMAHAAERRGTPANDNRTMILAPANKKGKLSNNQEPFSLAYQLPLGLNIETISRDEFLVKNLGLATFRYLLAVEYLYQFKDSKDGTLYIAWDELLPVMNMPDRTENRRRVRDGLLSAAQLRVYCLSVAEKETYSKGKKIIKKVAEHRFDPFLTVNPISFSDGQPLRFQEVVEMASRNELELFDGLAIRLTHADEDKHSFCYVPRAALELGTVSELRGLAIGRTILGEISKDWHQYGGVWKMPIFPEYPHGATGDFAHMERQGLLTRSGLPSDAQHKPRIVEQLPEWLEFARKGGMIGLVEYDIDSNTISGTAPLWLWNVMQQSKRAFQKGEPAYVKQLESAQKLKTQADDTYNK